MSARKADLFIKLRAMGDSVLLAASVAAHRELYPDRDLELLLPPAWAALYAHDPRVKRVHSWPTGRWAQWNMLRQLRARHFDTTYNFHAGGSSAWIARLSGARRRSVHFHGLNHPDRFSDFVNPGKGQPKPATERDLDALRAAAGARSVPSPAPRLFVTEHEIGASRTRFPLRGARLIVAPGASNPSKQWGADKFAELARRWVADRQAESKSAPREVVVIMSAAESALAAAFFDIPGVSIAVGLPLRELMALLTQSQCLVGNDSGPKHLAAALGVPTLTLFGPQDPVEWHPYDLHRHRILRVPDLSCRNAAPPGHPPWCGLRVCDRPGHPCMGEITVDAAWAALKNAPW